MKKITMFYKFKNHREGENFKKARVVHEKS